MGINSALGSSALLPAGLGFRNVLINGHMRVAQRGTAAVSTNDSFPVDRWKVSAATTGAWTSQQIPTATTATPAGFDYSLNFTKTTGGTAAAGDYNYLVQYIEGNNCSHFDWGTANAKTLMLSFWVRSGQVGTFGGSLRNSAANYAYCFTYTVNVINTWEYKTIQITGITAGTWLKDTSTGVSLFFDLGSGTNGRGAAGVSTGNYVGTTGTSLYPSNTTGGYINFTGVQLEQNYQPTPFEQRPIGVELSLCQRYYQRRSGSGTSTFTSLGGFGAFGSSTAADFDFVLPVVMRIVPHTLDYHSASGFVGSSSNLSYSSTSIVIQTVTATASVFAVTLGGMTGTAGTSIRLLVNNNTAGYLGWSAEL